MWETAEMIQEVSHRTSATFFAYLCTWNHHEDLLPTVAERWEPCCVADLTAQSRKSPVSASSSELAVEAHILHLIMGKPVVGLLYSKTGQPVEHVKDVTLSPS